MSKDPAFLFYYQDFAYGTRRMTFEEKGCYIELLCEQADSGHLSIREIKRILKNSFPIWNTICNKFIEDDKGHFFNKVLDEHILKRRNYTESRKMNLKGSHMNKHMKLHMEDEDVNVNKDIVVVKNINEYKDNIIPFELFWDLYDKKVGKPKCEKKWYNLSLSAQKEILEFIHRYKLAQPEKRYRKNPETFLNNKGWKDEIITAKRLERGAVDVDLIASEINKYKSNT